MNISAGIVIEGVIDGTTIGYQVVVHGDRPLEQSYNSNTGKCSPDWAAIWQDIKDNGVSSEKLNRLPRVYIKARDLTSGEDVTDSLVIAKVKYNDAEVAWNDGGTAFDIIRMVGKNDASYGLPFGVPCAMFIGNPADSQNNPDNDRITFSGTVVANGAQVSFSDIGKDVKIYPELSANTGYLVTLKVPDDGDSYIYDKKVSTIRVAKLWHDHELIDPAKTPHFFRYYDITGSGDTPLADTAGRIAITTVADGGITATSNKIEIFPDAVDSMMTLRCDAYAGTPENPGELLASAINVIYDLSDEYQVQWTLADNASFSSGQEMISSNDLSEGPRFMLRKGMRKYLRPTIVDKSGEAVVFENTPTWTFNADSPDGNTAISDMTDTNINNHTAGQAYCFIQYSDVVKDNRRRPVKIHAQTTI